MAKKKYSKITAWILSAMMVFTMAPSITFAGENDVEDAVTDLSIRPVRATPEPAF